TGGTRRSNETCRLGDCWWPRHSERGWPSVKKTRRPKTDRPKHIADDTRDAWPDDVIDMSVDWDVQHPFHRAAAAWRSCAIPENSAPNVDAASRGASMTRPPCAVRRTVTPDTRRWISAADGIGSSGGPAMPGASPDPSPAATTASISRSV